MKPVHKCQIITTNNFRDISLEICSFTCSHDNRYLFIGHELGFISIYDINSGEIIKRVRALDGCINSMVIFLDG